MSSVRLANRLFLKRLFLRNIVTQCSEQGPFTVILVAARAARHFTVFPCRPSNVVLQPGNLNAARRFSLSSPRHETHAVYNPQFDEDGGGLNIEITPWAAKRLTEIMTRDQNPYLALRVQVESGGCHGFQYLMSLVTLPETLPSPGTTTEDSIIREDDTVFTFAENGCDTSASPDSLCGIPKVVMDMPSLERLRGSKVDFTRELIGAQFKISDNPSATSSCGCGTSFDIKL